MVVVDKFNDAVPLFRAATGVGRVVLMLLLTLLLSAVLFRLVERPSIRLGRIALKSFGIDRGALAT